MARRNDGIATELLDALLALSRKWPPAGIIIGISFLGGAAYLKWINPKAMYGAAPIFALLLAVLALIFIGAAITGFLTQAQRRQRLSSQRSIADLHALTWQQFEQVIADLYRRMGYRVTETGGPGDGGIDLILRDAHHNQFLVQCKRYRSWKVGVAEVRDFYGAMAAHQTCCEGLFITCGNFSADALTFAQAKPLRLINGTELLSLLATINPIAPAAKAWTTRTPTTPAKPADYIGAGHCALDHKDIPGISSAVNAAPPTCPACHTPMTRRIAKSGPNTGRPFEPFWGCTNFPRCRKIVNIPAH